MLDGGIIKQDDLDERMPLRAKTVEVSIFRCPACDMPQFTEFEECPQCGIIVSKFRQKQVQAPGERDDLPEAAEKRALALDAEHTLAAFRGNLFRTGVYNTRALQESSNLKWKFKTGGWVSSSPAWTEAGLFFGSLDGNFYQIGRASCRERV